MGLLINQGIQDTTQDNKFKPIVAKDVMLEVTEIKLAEGWANTLEIRFRILNGQYKNKPVYDRVQYCKTPEYDGTWKYRSLRECAGVPYKEGEPTSIDIEKLLLHKAVRADLSIRKGKNKNGEEEDYQNVKYKTNDNKVTPTPTPEIVAGGGVEPTTVSVIVEPVNEPAPNATLIMTEPAPVYDISDDADWDN
jgi:hypothetical protein